LVRLRTARAGAGTGECGGLGTEDWEEAELFFLLAFSWVFAFLGLGDLEEDFLLDFSCFFPPLLDEALRFLLAAAAKRLRISREAAARALETNVENWEKQQ
jgi:hypothetical protein